MAAKTKGDVQVDSDVQVEGQSAEGSASVRYEQSAVNVMASEPKESTMSAAVSEFTEALAQAEAKFNTKAKSGLKAVTGAPTRSDLPEVKAGPKYHTGQVIEEYIKTLLDAGHEQEAGAIGNLYNRLVRGNWIRVPDQQLLLKE